MAFRFVHCADIHLDSPLRSLSLRNEELGEMIGNATRQAFVAIIDLCLAERVDALIIAGDLYDGDQTSMKTARFLADQMDRLHEAGITTYKIRGNHDAMSRITSQLVLPQSVKIFGGRADPVMIRNNGLDVMIQGISFANAQSDESLLPKYRAADPSAFNIGIMHTSLNGADGHDVYAPCKLTDLQEFGLDYWALGHIHQRSDYQGQSRVIMPGMPQGRDINEAGEKSVSLVTVHNDRTIEVEERLTSLAQFERVELDISRLEDWDALGEAMQAALQDKREQARSPHLVARLSFKGANELGWRMRRDRDLLLEEAQRRADRCGRTWIEKLEIEVEPPSQQGSDSADPLIELSQIIENEIATSPEMREEFRALVEELQGVMPPEARDFAGRDAEGLERFLDQMLQDGGREVMSRLRVATGGEG